MGLFHQINRLYALLKRNPEESYHVIINDGFVQVNHPWWGSKQINWVELQEVLLINMRLIPLRIIDKTKLFHVNKTGNILKFLSTWMADLLC